MNKVYLQPALFILLPLLFLSCTESSTGPSAKVLKEINLKSGPFISCGPPDQQLGSVAFEMVGPAKVKEAFMLGLKLLHSFEYDEAEKAFAKAIEAQPDFAMAYWGVAMSNFHPLWAPPTGPELEKGAKAVAIAQGITRKSNREADYIHAIGAFYKDWDQVPHRTRCLRFETAMEKLYAAYPNDKEAAIFYALSLVAAADPADKTYQNQKKAGAILNALYPNEPNHPGVVHYLIHAYDYPELAALALPAARKYASIAPSSAHALHMPSHIFTRLGLWEECIQSNRVSAASAKCYAEAAGIKGHWDEELHALDYLVYAYLQKGANDSAWQQWDYLKTMTEVHPTNFKVAYAYAAIPSRCLLENKRWKEAANLQLLPENFPWKDYPWQKAILHFTRLLGAAHTGAIPTARNEWKELHNLTDTLTAQKKVYEANLVQIQLSAGEAWIRLAEGKTAEALTLMKQAADREDQTEKHPVTPGEVIPARELLGDMLLQLHQPEEALKAYEADLKIRPNRFNALYGAALAAERSGNLEQATAYYKQLLTAGSNGNATRPELTAATRFLKQQRAFKKTSDKKA